MKQKEISIGNDLKSVFTSAVTYIGFAFVTFIVLFLFAIAGTSAIYVVFEWADELDDAVASLVLPVIGSYAGTVLFFLGFHEYTEYNLIRNTPTSKVRSAPVGRVEVKGTTKAVSDDELLTSPFAGESCVAYECEIEEYDHDDDGGDWNRIHSERIVNPFFLVDETGQILIDGYDAEWYLKNDYRKKYTESEAPERIIQYVENEVGQSGLLDVDLLGGETRRFTSSYLAPGDEIYAMGAAEPVRGELDEKQAEADLVLRMDENTGMFYLSDSKESAILTRKWWTSIGFIIAGVILVPGSFVILCHVLGVL